MWTWQWYQRQPKPRKVHATLAAIPVTPLAEKLSFPPLHITFSEPAARLEDMQQPALRRVRLEPSLAGNWHWQNDRELVFEPTEDWPAGRKFRVTFEKSFFPRHVLIEGYQHEFTTPAFAANMASCDFTEDSKEPNVQRVIARLELTHSVAPGELEKHVALGIAAKSSVFAEADPAPHFSIVYGRHNREAWIRSSPIVLPPTEDWLRVALSRGLRTVQGGAATAEAIDGKALIPARETAFVISAAMAEIVRNKEGEPEQILHVETRGEINTAELAKALRVVLLPKKPAEKDDEAATETEPEDRSDRDEEEDESEEEEEESKETNSDPRWESAAEITDELIEQAKPVAFTALPSDRKQDRLHHFRFRVEADGELYVRIGKGVRGASGYELAEDYANVVNVPELPREIAIQGEGGVLALTGERKLSIRSRGVPVIKFEIGRVRADQINHLVSQTEGDFQAPYFLGRFDETNISRIAREEQPISLRNRWESNYSAFDFSAHLAKPADGGSERGLFFLKGRGWDPAKKRTIRCGAISRFVLVTDLGLLVKKNADRSSDVFVVSIKEGRPVAGVAVELLGKNGMALQTAQTSAEGRASFGPISAAKDEREKKPVAYVARLGDDVSFIPYARDDRALNFSRFDIGGIEDARAEELDAFLFTERGVYRPGDAMHIGVIVKQRSWQSALAGVPVEAEVVDARGRKVQTTKLSLGSTGFAE
ncbi:MAG TPA: MG2 domain-containing protein, partial [Chthoniobacterales bacterium]